MLFGIHALAWTELVDGSSGDLLNKIADMGFGGVEITLKNPHTFQADEIRALLAETGLKVRIGVPMEKSLISDDRSERVASVAYLKECVTAAYNVGSSTITGVYYNPIKQFSGSPRTQDEWKRAVEGLQAVAEFASGPGVTLALEILNRYETYFLNTVEDGVRLVEEIGVPNVKLYLDTYHHNIEEKSIPEAIRSAGAHIGHFHASENDRGTPGSGHIDWPEVFAALQAVSYDGWVGMESFNIELPNVAPRMHIWRPPEQDMDRLASEGLTFLKRVAAEARYAASASSRIGSKA